jgi:hypothetical protein
MKTVEIPFDKFTIFFAVILSGGVTMKSVCISVLIMAVLYHLQQLCRKKGEKIYI